MYIVPFTSDSWAQYVEWFTGKGLSPPIAPKTCMFVADEEGLMAGTCIYVTDGPWAFVEHMQFRPDISAGKIRQAMRFGLKAIKGVCMILGKIPIIMEQREGISASLEECGYMKSPCQVWYHNLVEQPVEKTGIQEAMSDEELDIGDPVKVVACSKCGAAFVRRITTHTKCEDCAPKKKRRKKRK